MSTLAKLCETSRLHALAKPPHAYSPCIYTFCALACSLSTEHGLQKQRQEVQGQAKPGQHAQVQEARRQQEEDCAWHTPSRSTREGGRVHG
eukprot:6550-Heterococcus_DN1.PRE.2